uniref:Uncharacterized protein n=1 Tax=Marmota marmota marmota TaxID=9994 RepID=A0A8C6ETE9_MARMA
VLAISASRGGPLAPRITPCPAPPDSAGDAWGPAWPGGWGPDTLCSTWHLRRGLQQLYLRGGEAALEALGRRHGLRTSLPASPRSGMTS